MKHPLTSKERRGLVAVAAAALLCIVSGFLFRSCRAHNVSTAPRMVIVNNDSVMSAGASRDSISDKSLTGKRKVKSGSGNSDSGKRGKRSKRQKAEKIYPTRSPLDEPCD